MIQNKEVIKIVMTITLCVVHLLHVVYAKPLIQKLSRKKTFSTVIHMMPDDLTERIKLRTSNMFASGGLGVLIGPVTKQQLNAPNNDKPFGTFLPVPIKNGVALRYSISFFE